MTSPAHSPLVPPAGGHLGPLQAYIAGLEARKGWDQADAVRCCFLLGEEVGELFAAVRRWERDGPNPERAEAVGEEVVDCLNYLLAIAHRADVDLDEAFRRKNLRNESRSWPSDGR